MINGDETNRGELVRGMRGFKNLPAKGITILFGILTVLPLPAGEYFTPTVLQTAHKDYKEKGGSLKAFLYRKVDRAAK